MDHLFMFLKQFSMKEDDYFLNIFFYYKSHMLAYQKKKNCA